MFTCLGEFVSRHWLFTILAWVVVVAAVRFVSPAWDSVTHDGDLAYMPARMPSVQGEQLLQQAFPDRRARSEAVVVLAREDRPLDANDLLVLKRLLIRFQNMLGTSAHERAQDLRSRARQARKAGDEQLAGELDQDADARKEKAIEALTAAVDHVRDLLNDTGPGARRQLQPYAPAVHNLAVLTAAGGDTEQAAQLRTLAWDLDASLRERAGALVDSQGMLPLMDVWSRYTDRFGTQLVSADRQAELILLRLSDEFMAVGNIPLMEHIEGVLRDTRQSIPDWPTGLRLGLSGSAAVGSDMLRSASESIENTHLYTVVIVIAILLMVYRSPLLVVVPLLSIVASLLVATGLVAQLTTLNQWPGMEWWNFKIFTTTKIFVIVILFGAGTDYCLFLIARYKEELRPGRGKGPAMAAALGGVGAALAASALTTILGLATMYFAQFGKFRNSGPAIGLCLLVTLLACVTLAPALLRAMGGAVYWSISFRRPKPGSGSSRLTGSWLNRFWQRMADLILARPVAVLLTCTLALLPFFALGFDVTITYDLVSELSPDRISRRGAALLRQHFPIGESGPVVVLAQKPGGDFDSTEGIHAIRELTSQLYLSGVQAVRSLVAPTGARPSQRPSAMELAARNHRVTREIYLSKQPATRGDVTRLELVLNHDPFSLEATETLQRVDETLADLSQDESSYWSGSRFVFAGTTAAIRDLRQVTRSDNVRIKILVVLAVLIILLLLLKRPLVCLYLILSVLFSYYVTIGATELYFRWLYGDTFQGLDWKVPLFLFVILVAIGQDYNIYLATRVFEEQKLHGLFGGLRHAIVQTGGIITSCGVIMAGTFLSMMSGSMRGIVELGFALSLGVLLDTFIVRPILVPAFLAILFRWHAKGEARSPAWES